jgi:hypothetical protein
MGTMDNKLLSKEKHEQDYVKKIARSILKKTTGMNLEEHLPVEVEQLRRICKFISKRR